MSNSVGRILKLPAGKTEPRTKYFARVLFSPQKEYIIYIQYISSTTAGTSLICFPSELLVFCPKMSKWAIRSKKLAIHSFAHFWWATWAICSRSLISSERCERIIFGEQPERFAHIAQRKWANVCESLT